MLRFERHRNVSPSNIGVTVRCLRRLWLNMHHIRFAIVKMVEQDALNETLHKAGFVSELTLPDLSRIDLWHPEERLVVEIKHETPAYGHFLQVWEIQARLDNLGVENVECQLWYPSKFEKEVREFCLASGSDWMPTLAEYCAVLVDTISDEDLGALNQVRAKAQHVADLSRPPQAYPLDHGHCQHCGYDEFCHI